ncbi:MAG: phosphoglucomutase/phosphomannomutase family protein [Ruminococcaceae bacterium]|nr:phosphoglucomutase/phosphomannomutase family protein [Oscillospiraceae bacterium]
MNTTEIKYREPAICFGTGGWRGIIGDDFIKANILRVARAVSRLAEEENKADKPIVIGYDRRFLSETASRWIAEALTAYGFKVILIARSTPTPLIMFLVQHMNLHYGLEVTASHNPASYNGIKLIVDEGRDAPLETTARMEALIEKELDIPVSLKPLAQAEAEGLVSYLHAPFNDFIDHILEKLNCDVIKNRSLRILFDPMHGSGTYPLLVILQTLRCTVDIINDNKDAYFGGGIPAPTESRLKDLRNRVVDGGYDLGIAFDGDGDRLGVVDENGRYVDANEILCLLYYYLRAHKGWTGPVVRNLATTHMLDKIAASFSEECHEVPIGFKYISSAIDRYDAILGGESSGGLTVRGHIHGKDSIYAASLFIEMVCAIGSPTKLISELEARFGHFEMVEANLAFPAERKAEIQKALMVDKLLPDFGNATVTRVNYEDGCKVYFDDDSFVICRFSGTEPLLRIFAEAENSARAESYIAPFRTLLNI